MGILVRGLSLLWEGKGKSLMGVLVSKCCVGVGLLFGERLTRAKSKS